MKKLKPKIKQLRKKKKKRYRTMKKRKRYNVVLIVHFILIS